MRCLLVILLLLMPLSSALADEDAARFFTGRGRKALEEDDLDTAEEQFSKALSEHEGFVPALLGLAEAAMGRKDEKTAIGYLERCLDAGRKPGLPEDCREAVKQAEALLKSVDRPRLEYRSLVRDYVDRVLEVARKHVKSDRQLARCCAEDVLKIEPENKEAKRLLNELGPRKEPSGASGAKADPSAIFNGKDMNDWTSVGPAWKVEDGKIVGTIGDAAVWISSKARAEGDYTLTVETRILKKDGVEPRTGVLFGVRASYDYFYFDIFEKSFILSRYPNARKSIKLGEIRNYRVLSKFDPYEWNTVRVVVKGRKVTVFVNDRRIFSHEAEKGELDGHPGLVIQHGVVEYRKVTLKRN